MVILEGLNFGLKVSAEFNSNNRPSVISFANLKSVQNAWWYYLQKLRGLYCTLESTCAVCTLLQTGKFAWYLLGFGNLM